eukprot:UN01434
MSQLHYQRFTVKQLKEKLRKKKLRVSGKKQVLIDRLIEWNKNVHSNADMQSLNMALLKNAEEARKKANQMSDMDKYKMKRYLNDVMDNSNIAHIAETHTSNSHNTQITGSFQLCSKSEYLQVVEQQCIFWEKELNKILFVNFGKNKFETSDEYYMRICAEMETALQNANNMLEAKKFELQRAQENLLLFFAHFIGFSAKMYKFLKYLFQNPPNDKGWHNYRTYDFEMRRIKWILKQKKISKQDASLMKIGLESVWGNMDLEYDGNTQQFDGKCKADIIRHLFIRWK